MSCVTLAQWLPGVGLELQCADGGHSHKGSMAVDRNVYLHTGLALRSVEAPHSHASPGKGLPLVWAVSLWQVLLNSGALADRAGSSAAEAPTRAPASPPSQRFTSPVVPPLDGRPRPTLKPCAPPSPAGRSPFRRQARRQGRTPYGIVTTSASTNADGGTSTGM